LVSKWSRISWVDQHVDAAELVQRGAEHRLDRVFVGEVGLQGQHRVAVSPEVSGGFLGCGRGAAIMDSQGVTATGQGLGDVPTDTPFTAAGHQGHARRSHAVIITVLPLPTTTLGALIPAPGETVWLESWLEPVLGQKSGSRLDCNQTPSASTWISSVGSVEKPAVFSPIWELCGK
jgi:hypothetical protein